MKFKSDDEIFKLIKENPSRPYLEEYRTEAKEYRALVQGIGLEAMLARMPEFEREEMSSVRAKFSRSVVDLFERVLNQRSKAFSAKGGSRYYDLPDGQAAKLRDALTNVRKGMSLEKWVQVVALPAFDIDPMSVLLMEIDPVTNRPYPTYKGTTCIHEYKHDGRYLDYLILLFEKGEVNSLIKRGFVEESERNNKFYRVIDDARDLIIMQSGEEYVIKKVFTNYFGVVPGIISSDEYVFNQDRFVSSLSKIKALGREFLTDTSTKIIAKMRQMFAKEWSVRIPCNRCDGTGQDNGEDCKHCGGKGEMASLSVADRISVPFAEQGEKQIIPPIGYVIPPTEAWTTMNEELDRLERYMQNTFWGAISASQTNGISMNESGGTGNQQTATNSLLSEQPKNEKLRTISKWGQATEKFITDMTGRIMFPTQYKGSTVIYGDRYLLETPDDLMAVYEGLRGKGAPAPALDSALLDVYEAKFVGNPLQLRKHQQLMYIEPFVHMNVEAVMSLPIPDNKKLAKLYFSEWLQTISDMEIVMTPQETLYKKLEAYAAQYEIKVAEVV